VRSLGPLALAFGALGSLAVAVGCAGSAPAPRVPAEQRDSEAKPADTEAEAAAVDEAGSTQSAEPAPVAPKTPFELELEAAEVALDAGQLEQALAHFEQARSLSPEAPAPRLGPVRVRWAKLGIPSAYAEAPGHAALKQLVGEVEAILAEFPRFAPAWREKGRLLLVLGDAPGAQASLEQALALDASDAEIHSALGVAYLATGQTQQALERLEAAARLEPDNAERLSNLGTAYMLRGRLSEAIALYERSLALNPEDARTHGDLGAAHLADDRADRALPHLLRATTLAPDRATFLTNLGYAYQRQGQLEKALETQRRAIALDPKLGSAWINLGNVLADLGRYRAARAALVQAAALDPDDPRPPASLKDLAELEARSPKPKP
jgi:Flp pilus assembly protein TadD